jgi:uncharacterized membrane protein YkvA (DUF1232 family)
VTRLDGWRQRARLIKRDTLALYLACRHPRTPWYAKLCAALVAAYALSPIDLIPDVVPILGYLDDVILVPLGIVVAVRLIPGPVLAECREQAEVMVDRPTNRAAASIIVVVWIVAAAVLVAAVGHLALNLVD